VDLTELVEEVVVLMEVVTLQYHPVEDPGIMVGQVDPADHILTMPDTNGHPTHSPTLLTMQKARILIASPQMLKDVSPEVIIFNLLMVAHVLLNTQLMKTDIEPR